MISHAQLEALFPSELEIEQAYEGQRQAQHIARHGSLTGYKAARQFPCPGRLITTAEDANGMVTLGCNCCEWSTTARPEQLRSLESAPF